MRQQDEKTQKANKKTNQILIFNVSRRGGETLLITARKFSRFDIRDCSQHEHEHWSNDAGVGNLISSLIFQYHMQYITVCLCQREEEINQFN